MSTTYNALAAAIAREENSSYPNNPGGLMDSSGTTPLTFPDQQSGFQALVDKLQYDASGNSITYSPTMSLSDYEAKYTGGDPNAANNVASFLGVPTSTTLANLNDQALNAVNNQYQLDPTALPLPGGGAVNITPNGTLTTSGVGGTQTSQVSGSGFISQIENWLTNSSANVVSVLIGLVLIAGAVFSFSTVRDTVVGVAKRGAELAA